MTEALLTETVNDVLIRPMLTIDDAIDLWLSDLSRRGRRPRTRDNYRRTLDRLADRFPRHWDVAKVTPDDCEQFLAGAAHLAKGTQGQWYAAVNGLFRWLHRTHRIRKDPMEFVDPPGRDRPENLDVLTVSTADVRAMLAAADSWAERVCLAILAYLGPRRHAVALVRLRDYDRRTGHLRFVEKGGKVVWKPVPAELAQVLAAAIAAGAIKHPDDYLVPPEGPLARAGERDDRVIWRLVRKVAARAGVNAHVHALRAAFAVFYLEDSRARTGYHDTYGLQNLMGHESPATTQVYLRRLDKAAAMEAVRSLSWLATAPVENSANTGAGFAEPAGVGAGGFEPPFPSSPDADRAVSEPRGGSLADDLLDRAREQLQERAVERADTKGAPR